MTRIPTALRASFDDYAKAEDRVRALLLDRNPDQLNWRPEPGKWSIAQCVEYLSMTNQLLGNSIELALEKLPLLGPESDEIGPGLVWGFFLALLEPSVTLKGFAPRVLQPGLSVDPDRTWAGFIEGHRRLRSLADKCGGIDLNRLKFRHPVIFLKLSVGTAFLLLAVHERRHIGQAERVAASPEIGGHQ